MLAEENRGVVKRSTQNRGDTNLVVSAPRDSVVRDLADRNRNEIACQHCRRAVTGSDTDRRDPYASDIRWTTFSVERIYQNSVGPTTETRSRSFRFGGITDAGSRNSPPLRAMHPTRVREGRVESGKAIRLNASVIRPKRVRGFDALSPRSGPRFREDCGEAISLRR